MILIDQIRKRIKFWWNSLSIANKFGVVLLMLIIIGVIETSFSISAFQNINKTTRAASVSLETQRLSLEMSRNWESMQYYKYRFFSEYTKIGYANAKERYAIPAGEELSNIIRTGATLRRMTIASDASENLRNNNPVIQQFLMDINTYASELDEAVQMASDKTGANEANIQNKLDKLEVLDSSIKPNFTLLILMAQNEVYLAKAESENTQKASKTFMIFTNLFGVATAILIIIAFRKGIAEKVNKLNYASQQMQNGHLDERVDLVSKDEFGVIASSFNKMANAIQDRTNALREIEFRYQSLFNQSNDAVLLIGLDGDVLNANQRTLKMYGYSDVEMFGKKIQDFILDVEITNFEKSLEILRSGEDIPVFENYMVRKDGIAFPVEINITCVLDENERPLYFQIILRDISGRKQTEEQWRKMAMYDSLTGLPNRTNLSLRFLRSIENADSNHQMVAVLFLDLDGFKQVNDKFGHDQGDRVLIKISEMLRDLIRLSDLAARVGGDEFVVVLENISKPEFAGNVAKKIISTLSKPIKINGNEILLSTSLGISFYPEDGDNLEELINKADQAMYQVKANKKDGFQIYNREIN